MTNDCVRKSVSFGMVDYDIVLTVVVVPSTTVLLPVLGAFIRITGRAGDPLSSVPERRFFTAAATASGTTRAAGALHQVRLQATGRRV